MSRYILPAVIALAFVASTLVFFQVDTTEYVIVTQFGRPVGPPALSRWGELESKLHPQPPPSGRGWPR